MRFHELSVAGAFALELERREDRRGSFARAFCAREAAAQGLRSEIVQCNLSYTARAGTIRGLHFQAAPALEAKYVQCVAGSSRHAVVDLRPGSATFLRSVEVDLATGAGRALYVPELCAHGHQALTDDTEILYLVTGFYSPEHERGVRYDDPALGIDWPLPVTEVSDKDLSWPPLKHPGTREERR